MTQHLALMDVIALHKEIMSRLGAGAVPLRDQGGLESAVMRPRMAEAYEDADLVRQTALLAIGISQAQAFLDGNKRTAFAAIRAFLALNGHRYSGEPLDLARQLEIVAERSGSLSQATAEFELWLRDRIVARPSRS